MLKWTLEPLDDSYDQVVVRDEHGTAMGMMHVDAFVDGLSGQATIYDRLFRGDGVDVVVLPAEMVEAGASAVCGEDGWSKHGRS